MAVVHSKRCATCGETLPASMFSPDKRASTGLQSSCKPCVNKRRLQKYHEDPEAARKRQRDYYEAHKDAVKASNARSRERNAEAVKQRKKDYYERVKKEPWFKEKLKEITESRKEQKREYDRQYRAKNEEKLLMRAYEWRKKNPEKRKSISKSYKARRRAQESGGDSTAAIHEWEKNTKKLCYWCGCKCDKKYHIDHYQPLANGGSHTISNLVVACPKCNIRKSAKDPYEFAKSFGKLF